MKANGELEALTDDYVYLHLVDWFQRLTHEQEGETVMTKKQQEIASETVAVVIKHVAEKGGDGAYQGKVAEATAKALVKGFEAITPASAGWTEKFKTAHQSVGARITDYQRRLIDDFLIQLIRDQAPYFSEPERHQLSASLEICTQFLIASFESLNRRLDKPEPVAGTEAGGS